MRQTSLRWTTDRVRRSGLAIAVVLLAGTTACGSDSPAGPDVPTTPVGSYTIRTVNGKSLPVAVLADGSFTYEVTAGKFALTGDGKYSVVTTFRQTLPGSVSTFVDSTGGSWVLTGSTVQLTNAEDGSTDSGTWNAGVLTFVKVDAKVTTTYVYGLKK